MVLCGALGAVQDRHAGSVAMKQQLLEKKVEQLHSLLANKVSLLADAYLRLEEYEDENDRLRMRLAMLREHNLQLVNEKEELEDIINRDAAFMDEHEDLAAFDDLMAEYSAYDNALRREDD